MSDVEEAVGIEIPDDHVGAFVAEVFEDPERDTSWSEVVDAMVAPSARDAWDTLDAEQQVVEVLEAAHDYDRTARDTLTAVSTDGSADPDAVESRFAEARRCRTNADTFRDGVAAAYAGERIDDDQLVSAIETVGFDTELVADRESELERVANHFELDYQPYGGTLIEADDGPGGKQTAAETW
jgi:hypothetical protein